MVERVDGWIDEGIGKGMGEWKYKLINEWIHGNVLNGFCYILLKILLLHM